MTKEEFDREVQDLVDMLNELYRIKDRNLKGWLKAEIMHLVRKLLKV